MSLEIIKKYYKSCLIALLITLITTVLFAPFIFFEAMENKNTFKYNDDNMNSIGYKIEGNSFTSLNNDPSFKIKLMNEKINKINIILEKEIKENINVRIYTSFDGKFYEESSYSSDMPKGSSTLTLKFPEGKYSYLRVDIGEESGNIFNLHEIEVYKASYMNVFNILLLFGVFLICFYVCCKFNAIKRRKNFSKAKDKAVKIIKYLYEKPLLLTLTLAILIFIIIYHKFIFENFIYVFWKPGDIGGDTIDTYYPSSYLINRLIRNGDFQFFSLESGFGASIFSSFSAVLNPIGMFMLLFKPENIHTGIFLTTFIKYMVICFFGFKYFSLITKYKSTAIITTLIWTFSSYIVIWGQHYGFATSIAFFTVFIYYLHQFAIGTKKVNVKLIIAMAMLCITSYYFFYMSGLFAAAYVFVNKKCNKEAMREICSSLLVLFLLAIVAICLSAVVFLPAIFDFLNSARPSGIAFSLSTFLGTDSKQLLSILGRYLNADLLGNGYLNAYSGSFNYYEMAFLSVSTLSIFANSYFMIKRKLTIKISVLAIILITLSTNILGFLFTFANTYRWTYMYVFLFVIAIGKYLDYLFNENDVKLNKKVLLLASSIIISISLFILIGDKMALIVVNKKILCYIYVFFILYAVIIGAIKNKYRKIMFIMILLLSESIFFNYNSVNNRGISTNEEFFESNYFDGTTEVVNKVKERDKSLYRMNKTYNSRFLNDANVQGYNGMSSYNSTNSANLSKTLENYDVPSFFPSPSYLLVLADNWMLNGLFSVKYIISNESNELLEPFIIHNNKYVFKNEYSLPFGFLYENQVSNTLLDSNKKEMVPYYGYYIESQNEATNGDNIESTKLHLLNNESAKNSAADMDNLAETQQINFKIENQKFSDIIYLDMNIISKEKTQVKLFYSDNDKINEKLFLNLDLKNGENKISVQLPSYKSKSNSSQLYLQLDASNSKQDIKLTKFDCISYDSTKIKELIKSYESNSIKNLEISDSQVTGEIVNHTNEDKMLFLPIINEKSWSAQIDKLDVPIYTINGGFIGIKIKPGSYHIKLNYKVAGLEIGGFITSATVLSMSVLILTKKYKLKKEKRR